MGAFSLIVVINLLNRRVMSLPELLASPGQTLGPEEELFVQMNNDEKSAEEAFLKNLADLKAGDESVNRQPDQNITHIREGDAVYTSMQPPPAALSTNTEQFRQVGEFYQPAPYLFCEIGQSHVDENIQISYVEASQAHGHFESPPGLRYVENNTNQRVTYQMQPGRQVRNLPNAESLLTLSVDAKHEPDARKTAHLCKSVKDLKLSSPPSRAQNCRSRKRGKETVPTIEELKEEIERMEKNPNVDKEDLNKKRNNLACRTHRAKKKRHEEDLGQTKTTLEVEVEDLRSELKDVKSELKKTNDFLRQLGSSSEMPASLKKKIEKRLR